MKYKLHIPFMNRKDLLNNAVNSVKGPFSNIHIWATGTPAPSDLHHCVHELPPMVFTGTMNSMIKSSWDDDVMFFMHSDGVALNGSAEKFMRFVEDVYNSGQRWGVIFSCYDVLCAFHMRAVRSVGYWDQQYSQYTSEIDYYYRLVNAGWHKVDSNLGASTRDECGVYHDNGSSTIKADRLFNLVTQFRTRHDVRYHQFKWGGRPNEEQFFYPFDGIYLEDLFSQTRLLSELQKVEYSSDEGNLFNGGKAQFHTMYEYITRQQPKRILETGTNRGYFGYLLSTLLDDFHLVTCDQNEQSRNISSVLGNRVTFIHGDTRETLNNMDDYFDLAWIDGGHDYDVSLSDIKNAVRMKIQCIMIDDTNLGSVTSAVRDGIQKDYHIIEPYAFHQDPRRMVVALRK